jgi:hypothetical protein
VGTIPYMANWVLFLGALLSTLCHPAMALFNHCQQYGLNKEYISQVASRHPLQVNATTIVLVETKGRAWVTEEGEVKCKGEKFYYEGKHYEDLVISHQLAITLVEDTALINTDGTRQRSRRSAFTLKEGIQRGRW